MLRNVGSNWVLIVATIAATYVTTPFIIHTFGDAGYGTWTLITAITGYMALLSLGVPAACVRYLTQHVSEGDPAKMNRTIGTCAGLYLMVGGAALAAGAVLSAFFVLYRIPLSYRTEAYVAFGMMVVYVSLGFVGLLPEGILFAHHDFVRRNMVRLTGVALRLALTLGLLQFGAHLTLLATIQLVGLLFDFTASVVIIRRQYPSIRISLADFDWGELKQIVAFSLYVLIGAMGARLSFETDALVIGAFLNVGSIAFYAVANSLIVYLMEFVIGIAAVVAPMTTKLVTEGKPDALREMFLRWSKVALSLTMAAGLFLMVLGPRFIAWWIDPSYEEPSGVVLQILMLSSFIFLPVRGVAQPMLVGIGKVKVPTIALLSAGVLNLVMSAALARPLGLAGVAIGTAVPNVLYAVLVLCLACREVQIPLSR